MGNKLMYLLIAEYVVIGITFLWQRDYARALYWLGAIILSMGVLWMK